jgi:hypothetical protein
MFAGALQNALDPLLAALPPAGIPQASSETGLNKLIISFAFCNPEALEISVKGKIPEK